MDKAKALGLIMRKFKSLKKPESSVEIAESEAFSYLYQEIISGKNQSISLGIFAIVTSNLINFSKSESYFYFIERILSSHKFNLEMVCHQISIMSLSGISSSIEREKFYFYISLVIPRISYEVLLNRKVSYLQLFLIVLEATLRSRQDNLLPAYVDLLVAIMEVYLDNASKELAFVLANYSNVFRLCAEFPGCNSDDAEYLCQIADTYEKLLESG